MIDLSTFKGQKPGPALIVLGAVHGNEICGTRAIERLLDEFKRGTRELAAGQLTLVPVTNALAYRQGTRNGDRNLNRNLCPTGDPLDNEDRIANVLCPLLAAHDVLLDLHSFLSEGEPFVMVGPQDNQGSLEPFSQAHQEETIAMRLGPSRAVDGWLSTYAHGAQKRGSQAAYGKGTTEFMRSAGGCAVTLECGQHNDPRAPDVAYAAILNTLAVLRMTDAPEPPAATFMEGLRLVSVTDRDEPGDSFVRPWKSFDAVRAGDAIGRRARGDMVVAPADGYVVFPNATAAPGSEWFYFARRHQEWPNSRVT